MTMTMTNTVQLYDIRIPKDQFPVDNPMSVYEMSFLNKFWTTLTPLSGESNQLEIGFLKNIGLTQPVYRKEVSDGTKDVYTVGILCFTDATSKTFEPIKPLAHLSWQDLLSYSTKVSLGFDALYLRTKYASPFNWLMITEPITDISLEPITGSITESNTELITEFITESTAEPITEPSSDFVLRVEE